MSKNIETIKRFVEAQNNHDSAAVAACFAPDFTIKMKRRPAMKITGFSPLIVTNDAAKAIALFEELGFEKKHHQSPAENITDTTMNDAAGHRVDIAQGSSKLEKDLTLIRMNVDDFDEAFEFLKGKGFTNPSSRIVETESAKSAMIKSPSGFAFDLCQHKK